MRVERRPCHDCRRRRRCEIAARLPVWFPVPPTGYGGIERSSALLADGLVDAGHDVTLFASGDSQTQAQLESVFHDGAERADRAHVLGDAALACTRSSSAPTSSTSSTTTRGCSGSRSAGSSTRRSVTRCTGRSTDEPGQIYEQIARARAEGRAHLDLDEPAQAEAGPPLGRELPERARPLALPVPPQPGGDYLSSSGA